MVWTSPHSVFPVPDGGVSRVPWRGPTPVGGSRNLIKPDVRVTLPKDSPAWSLPDSVLDSSRVTEKKTWRDGVGSGLPRPRPLLLGR